MRVIATFLLLGVLCHCGLCQDIMPTPGLTTNTTASATQQDTQAPTGVSTPNTTIPAATTTATVVTTAATTTTGGNSDTTNTSGMAAPVETTPAPEMTTTTGTTGSVGTTLANKAATTNETMPANETTPATTTTTTTTVAVVTVSPEATTSEQPQQALPTVTSASSVSAPTATSSSTRAAATETTTALPTDAPASTAHTSHSPAEVPPPPQTQSPSSAATTVTVSQDAPGPGGAVTTGNGTGILPKTPDAPAKGEETVVYVKGQMDEKGKRELFRVCGELMEAVQVDKCNVTTNPDGTIKSAYLQVNPTVLKELQEKHKQKEKVDPPKNTTLIAILCSCAALLAMTAAFIAYTTCHRRSYRKNQQHLTEELQTVENGYHDNPTLEVMEAQPEMQEKKAAPSGEFNDSWIVPFDTKDDMPDEEDTHL